MGRHTGPCAHPAARGDHRPAGGGGCGHRRGRRTGGSRLSAAAGRPAAPRLRGPPRQPPVRGHAFLRGRAARVRHCRCGRRRVRRRCARLRGPAGARDGPGRPVRSGHPGGPGEGHGAPGPADHGAGRRRDPLAGDRRADPLPGPAHPVRLQCRGLRAAGHGPGAAGAGRHAGGRPGSARRRPGCRQARRHHPGADRPGPPDRRLAEHAAHPAHPALIRRRLRARRTGWRPPGPCP